MTEWQKRVVVSALVLLSAGCGFFSRAKNTFYALEPLAPAAAVTTIGGTPIGLEDVELPPGIDRRGIFVRGADNKVDVRDTHQWTSSLEEMVTHTLAFDLAKRVPEGMVILPGQAKPAGAMRSLYVSFEEIAPGPDNVFTLDARWTLRAPGGPELTGHEQFTIPLQSLESPEIVNGMNRALATLADRIVARL